MAIQIAKGIHKIYLANKFNSTNVYMLAVWKIQKWIGHDPFLQDVKLEEENYSSFLAIRPGKTGVVI